MAVFVYGGAGIFLDVDDGDWPLETKLDPAKVRKILQAMDLDSLFNIDETEADALAELAAA